MAPRPRSAWLLVAVASATLWVTRELEPWVPAMQLAAMAFSIWRRENPHPWQQSPIALNVGMFCITATTIYLALHGSPATLSLAHFAALMQGLQLLDTRPRKSEFLLVALALFQVVLAANLTDSVFFPPLLVVFLVCATWTLMVHTLHSEAIAAGAPRGAPPGVTRGLGRTTLLAASLSCVLALVVFVTLPRLRSSVFRGGMGPGFALSGFSNRVELGEIGRIRQDRTVVLRVETIAGEAPDPVDAYWRGLAFDRFDGRHWSVSPVSSRLTRRPVSGLPRFGVDLGGGPGPDARVQRVVREPVASGVVFSAGRPRRLEGPLDYLEMDLNGGLYGPSQADERVRYTVWSEPSGLSDAQLADDHVERPPDLTHPPRRHSPRFNALPPFAPEIAELARRITAGAANDAERARAIERALRQEGRYTDSPAPMGRGGERSPVEDFLLGDLAGHCEYFASGMVVLARSIGMPARLVNGFAGGRVNNLGGFVEVARADAHAWVEIHFARAGWVRYDPTPPDLRMRSSELSMADRIAQLGSVIELWWFQRIVDFDSADQILALKSIWRVWRGLGSPTAARDTAETARKRRHWSAPADMSQDIWLLAAALLAAELWRRRRGSSPRDRVPIAYRQALRLLARRGHVREAASGPRAFASEIEPELSPRARAALRTLTEGYLEERFGNRPGACRPELLTELRAGLKEPAQVP